MFIELELEPSQARRKNTFIALKGWLKQLVGDFKAIWAPRWILCDTIRTRQILGCISANGEVFVTALAAERAGISHEELCQELEEIFR